MTKLRLVRTRRRRAVSFGRPIYVAETLQTKETIHFTIKHTRIPNDAARTPADGPISTKPRLNVTPAEGRVMSVNSFTDRLMCVGSQPVQRPARMPSHLGDIRGACGRLLEHAPE